MSVLEAHETLFKRLAYADGILRPIESRTIRAILHRLEREVEAGTPSASHSLSSEMMGALSELADLPMRERERLVQLLWVVAMCDGELHPNEERMVLRVADALGVPRATVARQQPDL